ncbi:uncharacterized protein N7483_009441 [Penicillium malachiteum]|uniref:uncharacterized protein n=1 Tax=Penicillium malachiteum TaxID=1324776 RepID=UPI00254916E2|nr:uncharacterized protein N7483_009441 [Penicillium malachiteum]KAJ5721507.1 hypothetical protein N7483_009441 [Penicillium malachiteum]
MPSSVPHLPIQQHHVLEINDRKWIAPCGLGGPLHFFRHPRWAFKNDIQIPIPAYCPEFPLEFTLTPEPLLVNCYVKKAPLISYDRIRDGPEPDLIAKSVLMEGEICEILKNYPHPNIATYLGCQVSGGRITGLCFAKYRYMLMQEVNPENLMKRQSRRSRQSVKDYSDVIAGIKSSLRHLHSLGLVHNEINPRNIMLDYEKAVIIDFDSCRRIGEDLEDVGRTYEWFDEAQKQSNIENDLSALEEIRIWLGDDSKEFQFSE